MKLLLSIAIILIPLLSYGQQSQSSEDPYYYQVSGLVYVNKFDLKTGNLYSDHKIPKEPLRFRIVKRGSENVTNVLPAPVPAPAAAPAAAPAPVPAPVATGVFDYYVIQFFTIAEESNSKIQSVQSLLDSDIFVNSKDNNNFFWIKKEDLDSYVSNGFIKSRYRAPYTQFAYGASVSLPFKLRTKVADQNIKITPDITLGGYVGLRLRLSHSTPLYLTPMVSIGLATLALNENTTAPASTTGQTTQQSGDGLVLGVTRSIGAVFQLNDFQFGLMYGRDTAAGELGKDWIYNNKDWFSFSIGFSFLGTKPVEAKAIATNSKSPTQP